MADKMIKVKGMTIYAGPGCNKNDIGIHYGGGLAGERGVFLTESRYDGRGNLETKTSYLGREREVGEIIIRTGKDVYIPGYGDDSTVRSGSGPVGTGLLYSLFVVGPVGAMAGAFGGMVIGSIGGAIAGNVEEGVIGIPIGAVVGGLTGIIYGFILGYNDGKEEGRRRKKRKSDKRRR